MKRLAGRILSVSLAALMALCACGCASEADAAADALRPVLESYSVGEGDKAEGQEAPAVPDYGDSATLAILEAYGVDADELHRHCFARYSFEIGDVCVDDEKNEARVKVSITNVSLANAARGAASDYAVYAESEEAQQAYADNGHKALLQHLFELLYRHLDDDDLVTTEVDLSLSKSDDGSWSFSPGGNEEFFSALYGGSNVVGGLSSALGQQ